MTQEEKAKAYDKAIKRVEDIETGKCPKPFMFTEGLFDYIFPELKESEDEKIRKELICFLETEIPHCNARDKYIAWLEKQGEKTQGKSALEAINEEKVDNANKVEPKQEELTEFERFERAVKQVMEEAIECGDTHNLKADADMLLNLAHNSSWSEEDETNLRRTEYAVMKFFGGDCSLVGWLRKSLKERYTWKLSDEQLKAQKGKEV